MQKEKNNPEIDSTNECDAEEPHQKINGKKEDVNDHIISIGIKRKRDSQVSDDETNKKRRYSNVELNHITATGHWKKAR